MSVQDAEPDVPRNDSGRGLRMIGWFLLLWTAISMIWVPPKQWQSWYMPGVVTGCAIGAVVFLIWGYIVGARTPREEVLNERAHDQMALAEEAPDPHDDIVTGASSQDKVA